MHLLSLFIFFAMLSASHRVFTEVSSHTSASSTVRSFLEHPDYLLSSGLLVLLPTCHSCFCHHFCLQIQHLPIEFQQLLYYYYSYYCLL